MTSTTQETINIIISWNERIIHLSFSGIKGRMRRLNDEYHTLRNRLDDKEISTDRIITGVNDMRRLLDEIESKCNTIDKAQMKIETLEDVSKWIEQEQEEER